MFLLVLLFDCYLFALPFVSTTVSFPCLFLFSTVSFSICPLCCLFVFTVLLLSSLSLFLLFCLYLTCLFLSPSVSFTVSFWICLSMCSCVCTESACVVSRFVSLSPHCVSLCAFLVSPCPLLFPLYLFLPVFSFISFFVSFSFFLSLHLYLSLFLSLCLRLSVSVLSIPYLCLLLSSICHCVSPHSLNSLRLFPLTHFLCLVPCPRVPSCLFHCLLRSVSLFDHKQKQKETDKAGRDSSGDTNSSISTHMLTAANLSSCVFFCLLAAAAERQAERDHRRQRETKGQRDRQGQETDKKVQGAYRDSERYIQSTQARPRGDRDRNKTGRERRKRRHFKRRQAKEEGHTEPVTGDRKRKNIEMYKDSL